MEATKDALHTVRGDTAQANWLRNFNTETTPVLSESGYGPLLGSCRSHHNIPFCEYAWNKIILISSHPGHSTHLQTLGVGIFAPPQKAYGDPTAQHMKDTRTGIAKGTFWAFYRAAQAAPNVKSFCNTTGIVLYNPDAVLTLLLGYNPPPAYPQSSVPKSALPFKHPSPANRRGLRQQKFAESMLVSAHQGQINPKYRLQELSTIWRWIG